MGKFRKWFHPNYSHEFHVEAYSFKDATHTMLSFGFDRGGDSGIRFAIGIHWLFCFFFGYQGKFAPQWEKGLPFDQQAREVSLRVFDGALWVVLWENPHGWAKGSRQWTIRPMDILFGQVKNEVLPDEGYIPCEMIMPEGVYPLVAKRDLLTRTRPRLPFWKEQYHIVNIDSEKGIPFPGKGENSWDLGDDASFSISGPAESIEEMIAKWKAYILRDRERYGGHDWMPDA